MGCQSAAACLAPSTSEGRLPSKRRDDMDEEDSATLSIKYCPATARKSPRSLIRQGQCITLGELFVWGAHMCSLFWDLYRTYTSLDIFIRKIASGSEEAACLSNAKRNPHLGTGKFGVDW